MNRFETSEWLVLNNLIYKIYTIKDLDDMRSVMLEQLKLLMDFDSADFSLVQKEQELSFHHIVTYNCEIKEKFTYDEPQYFRDIVTNRKSVVFRETDVVPEEIRVNTSYYHNIYAKNNWNYALHMVLVKEHQLLGYISLYRAIGKDNFHYDDIVMLDLLKEHLTYRLYEARQSSQDVSSKITIHEAVKRFELTKREEMILKLLMEGVRNEEICEQLGIRVNTLKKHVLNIYRKLGIKNRVQMFKMILEQNE